jgi:DnaJ family protein A protein 2
VYLQVKKNTNDSLLNVFVFNKQVMVSNSELYQILEIEKNATALDIKKSYKKLALIHHPDKNGGDDTKFKEIDAAYKVLSDPDLKQQYDETGEIGRGRGNESGSNPFDFFSQFTQFFGGNGNGQQAQQRKTKDNIYNLQISLEDLYKGSTVNINFARNIICIKCDGQGGSNVITCKTCSGKGFCVVQQRQFNMVIQTQHPCSDCKTFGKIIGTICTDCKGNCVVSSGQETLAIKIPPNIKNQGIIRFNKLSNEMVGCITGDLLVVVSEIKHQIFTRRDNDLLIAIDIPLITALLGGDIEIPQLNGEILNIKIPKGNIIRPNEKLVLDDKGMPLHNNPSSFGKLEISFNIIFPENKWAQKVNKLAVEKIFNV